MAKTPEKFVYSASKDREDLDSFTDPLEVASRLRQDSQRDTLKSMAMALNGEITYIGRLAIALPDAHDWTRIIDRDGRTVKLHYSALPDEYLIQAVFYGEQAQDVLKIDLAYLDARLRESLNTYSTENVAEYNNLLERRANTALTLGAVKECTQDELRQEFEARRAEQFLAQKDMEFEKTINRLALANKNGLDRLQELGLRAI